MELAVGIIVGIIIITILVVLHELGHAVLARRNGVVVEEFGIGFPPAAWSRKFKNKATNFIAKGKVLFSINWLPLGGFVKLQGEYDSATKKGDYGAATYWQKTKILLAGVAINWITAAVLFMILAWIGMPKILPNQFSVPGDTVTTAPSVKVVVSADSPAERAGLKTQDELVKLGEDEITSPQALMDAAAKYKGQTVPVTYIRDGNRQIGTVLLRPANTDGKGYIGLGASQQFAVMHSTWSAPIVGVGTAVQMTAATFEGLGKLVAGLGQGIVAQFSSDDTVKKEGNEELEVARQSVSGPVGIFGVIFPAATSSGLVMLLFITAVISLSLAVMNTLPIPGLDGGRWFLMTLFKLLKKPLTKEIESKVNAMGISALLLLIVVVTVADVSKFFN